MAESITKTGKLKRFPPANSEPEAVETPPTTETIASEEVETNTTAPLKRRPGRPPAGEKVVPKTLTFFDRLQQIPKEDWGTRATVKVYRLYPVTNRLVNVDNKFVCIYGSPGDAPLTEEQLKVDHGSGKYRLYLNYKGPGAKNQKELDAVEVSILDPSFPPRIPDGEWMEDPRNKDWAWAKKPKDGQQANAPAPRTTLSEVADILRVQNEIRKEAREELQQGTSEDSTETNVFSMAQEMLKLQVNNPMVGLLMQRMEAMDKANEAARAREFELQKELRTLSQPKSDSGGGLLEQLKALAEAKDTFKTLLGIKDEVANIAPTVVKSKMSGTMEFLKEMIPQTLNAPVLVNLSQALLYKITSGPQAPMNNPAQPTPMTPQPTNTAAQTLEAFVRDTITPAMISYLEEPASGTRFAEWLYAGFPERLQEIQNITHAQMPGMKGAAVIQQFYRHSPLWVRIAGPQAMKLQEGKRIPLPPEEIPAREQAFNQFVEEFCAYDPDKEEEPITDAQETEGEAEEVNV